MQIVSGLQPQQNCPITIRYYGIRILSLMMNSGIIIISEANLDNGQLLGGNSSFLNNVYGDFTQNGNKKFMQRDVQFSGKLDIDMRFITEGLSASLYGGMNFFNTLYANQSSQFCSI